MLVEATAWQKARQPLYTSLKTAYVVLNKSTEDAEETSM